MKYYIDENNTVFAYEPDGSQDHLIGNKIQMTDEELEAHINPPKTLEQLQQEITNSIQNLLDTKAKELRYDNMMSARSYAGFVNPFQAEAEALSVWCANCWLLLSEIEKAVTQGTREMPSVEEVQAEMPIYEEIA